jgi:hypothetical protein
MRKKQSSWISETPVVDKNNESFRPKRANDAQEGMARSSLDMNAFFGGIRFTIVEVAPSNWDSEGGSERGWEGGERDSISHTNTQIQTYSIELIVIIEVLDDTLNQLLPIVTNENMEKFSVCVTVSQ